MDKFAGEQIDAENHISLARAQRLRTAASESKAYHNLKEALLLQHYTRKFGDLSLVDPPAAAALAQAAKNSLKAAERLAQAELLEAEELLIALKDTLDQAHGRVQAADFQLEAAISGLDDPATVIASPDLGPHFDDPLPFDVLLPEPSFRTLSSSGSSTDSFFTAADECEVGCASIEDEDEDCVISLVAARWKSSNKVTCEVLPSVYRHR